jgi:D-serine deaminase-like pyridoxal phosphate-dependent protein
MSLPEVLERIALACQRAGRDPKEVRLVAVTKGRTVEEIREKVLRYGAFPLGESRVQEALKKMELLQAEWHLVGSLQRNKAKFAPRFHLIHSLDSLRLAEALEGVGAKAGMRLRVLVEVNLGREPQKHGFLEEELPEALARVREMPHLRGPGPHDRAPHGAGRGGPPHLPETFPARRPLWPARALHGHVPGLRVGGGGGGHHGPDRPGPFCRLKGAWT